MSFPVPAPPPNHDDEHLRLLVIFHYVHGRIVALFALFPIMHVVMGVVMLTGGMSSGTGPPPPAFMGWMFVGIGALLILGGETMAAMSILAATCLKARRAKVFCMVVAGINCLHMPVGTVLGVFTLIVLSRPSVAEAFRRARGVAW
jgi:hypothetical protein